MLACLVMLAPGIIAAILYNSNRSRKLNYGKLLLASFIAMIVSNILVRAVLFIIGIRNLKLSDMNVSFKLNYFILESGILLGFLALYQLMSKESRKESMGKIKKIFPMLSFFIITFCIFIPSSLFLGNIMEFSITYTVVFPILLVVAFAFAAILIIFAVVISGERLLNHYAALIFGITLGLYVQSNFLNYNLPELDGTKIDWSAFKISGVISGCFWCACILGLQAAVWVRTSAGEKNTKDVRRTHTVMRLSMYVSYFLSAIQVVTLIVLLFTTDKPATSDIVLIKEDEFSVGTNNNIIMFIVDSLESRTFEEVVVPDSQFQNGLEDFTFYRNIAAGGAPTALAVPLLLTGIEYEPTWTTYAEYLREAWNTTELYTDLSDYEFDVRIFAPSGYVMNVTEKMIDNAEIMEGISYYYIADYYDFTKYLYKFAGFYSMPQCLKQYCWFYGDDILNTIAAASENKGNSDIDETDIKKDSYYIDDVQYYDDFNAANGLDIKYKNTFRVYHLQGAHAPYTMNENMERVNEENCSEVQQIQGTMKILSAYIEALKDADIYDDSTIIIIGDHGHHSIPDGIEQNPTCLIKEANEKHHFVVSEVPIHFRNVVATIARSAFEDYTAYGPSVYDIDENSDVERLHTVKDKMGKRVFPDIDTMHNMYEMGRYIIPEDARDSEGIEFRNLYSINRISYQLGNPIYFNQENVYADSITYRLYKENGLAIASNELTLCFELADYKSGDLEFSFVYQDLYNDTQKLRIYAKGQKVADMICTKEEAGGEKTVVIPGECVEDNILVLRMVFPNAVTPHQLDAANPDTRVLSVAFESMDLQ